MKMKAAVLYGSRKPFQVEEVDLADPKHGELRIKLKAAGVCHSDMHLADGKWGERFPIVLGHEGAGVVDAIGPGVAGFEVGDRVVLTFVPYCGHCSYCNEGKTHLCETAGNMAYEGTLFDGTTRISKDGQPIKHFNYVSSFAEYAVVPANGAIKIPDGVPFEIAALIGCGVTTGVGAVINTAGIEAGSQVAVIGCGGVGLNVIAGAKLAGASKIIGVDIFDHKLEAAKKSGADHVINSKTEDPVAAIKQLTGRGVDYAFEVIGMEATLLQAWHSIKYGGTVVAVGAGARNSTLTIPSFEFICEKNIKGCYYGSAKVHRDLPLYINLYMNGRLELNHIISHRISLAQINDAFQMLKQGDSVRTVITFE